MIFIFFADDVNFWPCKWYRWAKVCCKHDKVEEAYEEDYDSGGSHVGPDNPTATDSPRDNGSLIDPKKYVYDILSWASSQKMW